LKIKLIPYPSYFFLVISLHNPICFGYLNIPEVRRRILIWIFL
jgi:hypothetical protein